jgi:hypothetical protein
MKEFTDASVFLGMHSKDERVRIPCKNYFVERLNKQIGMSLEQVGKCDDVIWRYTQEQQDAYYPFMDNLHTVMDIERIPYNEKDIQEAQFNQRLHGLDISDRLTAGMALAQRAVLYSVNPQLVNFKPKQPVLRFNRESERASIPPAWFEISDFIRSPEIGKEQIFPDELERLYQQSLVVRI